MKLALADVPSPLLAERRVLACGSNGAWHDFADALDDAGIAVRGGGRCLPQALALLAKLPAATRRRIERLLDARADGHAAPAFRAPIDDDAKLLLTEGSIALSRSNDQRPAEMVVGFSKFATSFGDPGAAIRLPDAAARYDVEAALVAVIGQPAARMGTRAAARSVVGFTLLAEITHRDMFETEARTNNSLFAKNCPGLSPCGPTIWIGGLDELDASREVTLTHNGVVRQRFVVGDFSHTIAEAVKAWSRVVLEPGDMVALGAAICRPRPGNAVDSPIPIAPGDTIEVTFPPIGALAARIAA
jgi:2-keto-4-pentenoate hydratase/2-oxohepta-3-ene-1,7-dioic acid hydratase in catechol pathway